MAWPGRVWLGEARLGVVRQGSHSSAMGSGSFFCLDALDSECRPVAFDSSFEDLGRNPCGVGSPLYGHCRISHFVGVLRLVRYLLLQSQTGLLQQIVVVNRTLEKLCCEFSLDFLRTSLNRWCDVFADLPHL